MTSFFGELKHRNVVKVAVVYAIVECLLIEIESIRGLPMELNRLFKKCNRIAVAAAATVLIMLIMLIMVAMVTTEHTDCIGDWTQSVRLQAS